MKGKKSFVLYSDLKGVLDQLPDDIAGKLFKLIVDYVNDLDPKPEELVLRIAFEQIKQQLKRDLEKWESIISKRSSAGQLSAAQKSLFSTSVNSGSTESTVNVNVNGNGNVNWDKLIEVFNLIFDKKCKVMPDAVRKKYLARIKEGYSKRDIIQAMKNAKKDEHHKSTNYTYCTLEFFSRADKLDRFINELPTKYVPTK